MNRFASSARIDFIDATCHLKSPFKLIQKADTAGPRYSYICLWTKQSILPFGPPKSKTERRKNTINYSLTRFIVIFTALSVDCCLFWTQRNEKEVVSRVRMRTARQNKNIADKHRREEKNKKAKLWNKLSWLPNFTIRYISNRRSRRWAACSFFDSSF